MQLFLLATTALDALCYSANRLLQLKGNHERVKLELRASNRLRNIQQSARMKRLGEPLRCGPSIAAIVSTTR